MAQGTNEKYSPGPEYARGMEMGIDADEREPTIFDRVERLRKSVAVQNELNSALEEKLQYVLSPEPPTSEGSEAIGKADYPRSDIEQTLIVLETQFAYQARRTESIMRRINL